MGVTLTGPQADVLRLLRDSGETHVYDLKKQLGTRSVYVTVLSLEVKGLLESRWEPSPLEGRPARKIIRLTALGGRVLAAVPPRPTRVRPLVRRPAIG